MQEEAAKAQVLILERPRGVYKGWDSKIPNLLGSLLPLQQTLSGVQWGLTPTSVNSAHAPSKGGHDSRVSRESTTGIGCSDKQPSRSPDIGLQTYRSCNHSCQHRRALFWYERLV
ncbi:hypothetical protein Tco_0763021 [Tanacetum coccineum]